MENQKNILKFDLSNKNLKIKKLLNQEFLVVEMKAISSAYPNRNMSHFTKEAMEKAIPTFYNKPVLGAFFVDKNDFDGHNGALQYDKELEEDYYDYTDEGSEIPLGVIREQDNVEVYKDDFDGLYWVKFTCALWCKYSYRAIKRLLKSPNGKYKISVEVEVTKWHMEGEVEVIDEFTYLGVCILGNDYTTGIAGAELTIPELTSTALFQKKQKCLSFAYNALENKDTMFSDELTQVSEPVVSNENPKEEISMEVGQTTTERENSMLDENKIQVMDSEVKSFEEKPADHEEDKVETEACEDTKEESCENKEVESAEETHVEEESHVEEEACEESCEEPTHVEEEAKEDDKPTEKETPAEEDKTEEPETEKECKMSEESTEEECKMSCDEPCEEPVAETECKMSEDEHEDEPDHDEHDEPDHKDEHPKEEPHEDEPEECHCSQFVMIGEEKCDINSLYEKFCALSESYTQMNTELDTKKSEFAALNEKYTALVDKFKAQEADEYVATANAMIDGEARIFSSEKKQEIKNLVSEKCHKFEFANIEEVKKFTVTTLAMALYEQPVESANENKETFSVNITAPNTPPKKLSKADDLREAAEKLRYI